MTPPARARDEAVSPGGVARACGITRLARRLAPAFVTSAALSPSLIASSVPLVAACAPLGREPAAPETSPTGGSPGRGEVLSDGGTASGPEAERGRASLGATEPPPDGEPTRLAELGVEGFEPAIVSVPRANGRPKPVLVATHGAGDRAEWHCELWRAVVGARGFVLCPRGRRVDARASRGQAFYYFPTHYAIEREVDAELRALADQYGARVDTTRVVYVGFSQGAMMGALVVARNPARFGRALLIEGAYGVSQIGGAMARMFKRGGGERVGFVCGGWYCARNARASAESLRRAGVPASVTTARGGHTYGGEVARRAAESLDWLLEGDARWAH